jgi:hypothetical protein
MTQHEQQQPQPLVGQNGFICVIIIIISLGGIQGLDILPA